jgi:hypothetical protein
VKCLRATALAENSCKFALQLIHSIAVSGDEALQREQVCKAELLSLLFFTHTTIIGIVLCEPRPAKVFLQHPLNRYLFSVNQSAAAKWIYYFPHEHGG